MLPENRLFGEYWSLRQPIFNMGITGERWDEPRYHKGNEQRPGAPIGSRNCGVAAFFNEQQRSWINPKTFAVTGTYVLLCAAAQRTGSALGNRCCSKKAANRNFKVSRQREMKEAS